MNQSLTIIKGKLPTLESKKISQVFRLRPVLDASSESENSDMKYGHYSSLKFSDSSSNVADTENSLDVYSTDSSSSTTQALRTRAQAIQVKVKIALKFGAEHYFEILSLR